jgi:hypothetical protein
MGEFKTKIQRGDGIILYKTMDISLQYNESNEERLTLKI